jgi:hypothetical protein
MGLKYVFNFDTEKLDIITGAVEGTAILSTGEAGGTKFLREDGDGTCSWQSVGAGSGATTALDNLSSVAINTSLISDTNDTDDLGTLLKSWNNTFSNKVYTNFLAPHADGTTAIGFYKADGTTSVLNVDTTNSRIGIGTTAPQSALDIGTGRITGGTNSATYRNYIDISGFNAFPAVEFVFPGGSSGGTGVFRSAQYGIAGTNDIFFQAVPLTTAGYGYLESWNSAGFILGTGATTPANAGDIIFKPGRTEKARLTINGKFSMGTWTGDKKLVLYDNDTSPYGLGVQAFELRQYFPTDGHLSIGTLTGSTFAEKVRVQYDGKVGIGTNAPGNQLHLVSSTDNDQFVIQNTSATGYANFWVKGTGRTYQIGTAGASATGLGVNDKFFIYDQNAIAMRFVINTSGNVGLSTTDPKNRLDVSGGAVIGSYAGTNTAPTNGLLVTGSTAIGNTTNVVDTATFKLLVKTDGVATTDAFGIQDTTVAGYSNFHLIGTARTFQIGVGNNSETLFGVPNKYFIYDRNASLMRMVIDTSGNMGVGTVSPSARFHSISTTEQLRLGYDVSNYLSATIDSTGSATFALTGTTPKFTFSQAVKLSTLTSGRIPFATTGGELIDDGDLTFATDTLTATKIVGTTSVKVGTAAGFISSDGSTGATGSFTTVDLKTVTVKDGIITSIV